MRNEGHWHAFAPPQDILMRKRTPPGSMPVAEPATRAGA
jgi:hypothetical protein